MRKHFQVNDVNMRGTRGTDGELYLNYIDLRDFMSKTRRAFVDSIGNDPDADVGIVNTMTDVIDQIDNAFIQMKDFIEKAEKD